MCNKFRSRLGPEFECQAEFRFYDKMIITIYSGDYQEEMCKMA